MTAWRQDLRTRWVHHVHTSYFVFASLGVINHFSDICTTYCVSCITVAEYSLPFVQCSSATRVAHYSASPVGAAATATTHNHGIAATAVAGTGWLSCCSCCCCRCCCTLLRYAQSPYGCYYCSNALVQYFDGFMTIR